MSERVETVTRRGERRGVQLVLGVEDQRQVERLRIGLGGDLAVDHVQEVGGVVEVVAGGNDGAVPSAIRSRNATAVGIWAIIRSALRTLAA